MDPFAGRSLDRLKADDFLGLVDRAIPENIHLDYKLKLQLFCPDQKQQQKFRQDFLADVTAFANSHGGVIVYGVQEDSREGRTGCPEAVVGFEIENPDEYKRTIEALFRDGIEERLPFAPEVHTCPLDDGKFVLAIRCRRSMRQPHRVVLGGHNGFYLRVNTQNQLMNTSQIRDAVLGSASYLEKIETFINDRVGRFHPSEKTSWMMHVIPLEREESLVDVTNAQVINCLERAITPGSEANYTVGKHCLEGYVRKSRSVDSRITFFRNGAIELYDTDLLHERPQPRFHHSYFEDSLFKCLSTLLEIHESLGISYPMVIAFSVSRISELHLAQGDWNEYFRHRRLGRDHQFQTDSVGPFMCFSNEKPEKVELLVKPFLDVLWNAAGHERCAGFDSTGEYIGYRSRME